ncbi:hypothetical protein KBC75_00725 [Candidatus Shapirobacteria bacterium]|nr:hypothetical protein [Candidatus Shapirobacteria bacterium]
MPSNLNISESPLNLDEITAHDAEVTNFVGKHIESRGNVWELRPRLGLFLSDDDLRKLVSYYWREYREQKNKPE